MTYYIVFASEYEAKQYEWLFPYATLCCCNGFLNAYEFECD